MLMIKSNAHLPKYKKKAALQQAKLKFILTISVFINLLRQ